MRSLLICLSICALAACSSPLEPPGRTPDSDGSVDAVDFEASTVLIKSATDACGTIYHVTKKTDLMRVRSSGGTERVVIRAISPGAHVQAWFTGVRTASCPGAAEAEAILLL